MINVFKKPLKVEGKEKNGTFWYAAFSRKGTADTIELAQEMGDGSSSFTKGEIVGITIDLPNRIKHALLNGKAVKINGLGVFKPSLTVDEVKADPKELRTSAISIKSLNFTPDAILLQELNAAAKFEWIKATDADDEDAADTTDGNDEPKPDTQGSGNGQQQTGTGSNQDDTTFDP